jgi:hypothetical protein
MFELDEEENKTIQGIIKTGMGQHAGLDIHKYCDVCSAEHLSSHAYLAPESGR